MRRLREGLATVLGRLFAQSLVILGGDGGAVGRADGDLDGERVELRAMSVSEFS